MLILIQPGESTLPILRTVRDLMRSDVYEAVTITKQSVCATKKIVITLTTELDPNKELRLTEQWKFFNNGDVISTEEGLTPDQNPI